MLLRPPTPPLISSLCLSGDVGRRSRRRRLPRLRLQSPPTLTSWEWPVALLRGAYPLEIRRYPQHPLQRMTPARLRVRVVICRCHTGRIRGGATSLQAGHLPIGKLLLVVRPPLSHRLWAHPSQNRRARGPPLLHELRLVLVCLRSCSMRLHTPSLLILPTPLVSQRRKRVLNAQRLQACPRLPYAVQRASRKGRTRSTRSHMRPCGSKDAHADYRWDRYWLRANVRRKTSPQSASHCQGRGRSGPGSGTILGHRHLSLHHLPTTFWRNLLCPLCSLSHRSTWRHPLASQPGCDRSNWNPPLPRTFGEDILKSCCRRVQQHRHMHLTSQRYLPKDKAIGEDERSALKLRGR